METRRTYGAVALLRECRESEVLIEGRAGTGKTLGILDHVVRLAIQYPRSRHLVCRHTRTSCTESVLVTLETKVFSEDCPLLSGASRLNRHDYQFPNGSTIVVGGLDQPERLYSTEWDTIYVAEATEITEDAWERFARAMRNGRMPYAQRVADCNPQAPSHWLNRRAEPASDRLRSVSGPDAYRRLQDHNRAAAKGRMKRLISVHQDNPYLFDLPAWSWTEAGQAYLAELDSLSGHRRERLLNGRWIAAEGTVYPEFSEARHVIAPFPLPADWPIHVALDPGFDHPCAILWFAIGPNGCYYIIDELYRGGLGVPEHAKDILARNAGRNVHRHWADPQHAFSHTAQSPRSIAEQFAECGVHFAPWPRTAGNEESMVEQVRRRLATDRLKIFPNCRNTIEEFQSWRYKRTISGELPAGEDAFEDRNNHAMDCVKGFVATSAGFEIGQPQVLTEAGIRPAKGPVYPNTERAVRILRQRAGGRAGGW